MFSFYYSSTFCKIDMLRYITFACLLLCTFFRSTFAQNEPTSSLDSLILHYQHLCTDDPANTAVLTLSDTLFDLAAKAGNLPVQAAALRAKLDHYYYNADNNDMDSIIVWVDRVKAFAKGANLPEYYYFVWSARLINQYIRLGEYNIALVETDKMLKEAEAEDYKEGIADCYGCMSNIYSAKQLPEECLEFLLKEIEIFEKYHLKRPNISLKYSDAASILITEGQYEKANELIQKAIATAQTSYHQVTAQLAHTSLHVAENELQEAEKDLVECHRIYTQNPALKRHISYLYEVEITYYRKTKKYDSALQSLELYKKELERKSETVTLRSLLKTKGDIFWEMNRKEEAGELYRSYFEELKKEKEENEEIATSEFATLLNMQKLNAEKKELEDISKEKELQNIRLILFFLLAILVIFIFFLYYQSRMHLRLIRSANRLDERNQELTRAEEELRKAKEIAEQSNMLKTLFIQNMSHEIRTPLNSIVGFSAVLASLFEDENEEVQQFASLIELNSQLLLKLISDILDLSELDEVNLILRNASMEVNECCRESIETVRPILAEGVELLFQPACTQLVIENNRERIVQVLGNLLSNAAKFTSAGQIMLAYEVNEKELRFTITDTGIGIPAQWRARIFERFFKVDEFTQGTGLGLPVSHVIAERMGGYLRIDETYTEGTRMVFGIPV